ncbi:MAG TPA: alpha-glucan family phosphorylase, partial [Bacteroidota bacterium]|nr:alpha-glucan family phosphorylase [Bacteroidota bacterium]
MAKPISTITVSPTLPKELANLSEMAHNLLWVWDYEIKELFIRLDPDLWEQTNHNPVEMLGKISQDHLTALAHDEAFLAQLDRAFLRYVNYLPTISTWFAKTHPEAGDATIAYFSAEFGLTESLQVYSGGLGMLAGDHLKSASDLGLPLVGVGLMYQYGYFRQYLNADGWQQERYNENDFYNLPTELKKDGKGNPILVSVLLAGRELNARIWEVSVGRIRLFLLDANIPDNTPDDRGITAHLYGGDNEMRIQQEILLGIGGYRALKALGISPTVFHANEGHSAFLTLERCRDLMAQYGVSFAEAREATTASMVFTTHTPVPAGNDYFSQSLMEKYFPAYSDSLGLTFDQFLGLGRQNPGNFKEDFCMTVLALRMAGASNGVSKLHGEVSREMWRGVWPNIPPEEIPIGSITNGVHAPSWISGDMGMLYERYLGPGWRENGAHGVWDRVDHIPDEELWRTHVRRRERLIAFARQRLEEHLEERGLPPSEVAMAKEVLNPSALTIGFGRRFATYKRATLILRNPDRLLKILTNKECPVQIIIAGKAHPKDTPGKELIRQIIHFERSPEIRRRMVFLEDYDMVTARYMVQGVDLWLNTPRRPMEASGTSGMKAAMNGAINVSILDGWWVEGYNRNTGWAIGRGEVYGDEAYQDDVESDALYDLLEKEIVPLYYRRGADDLPRAWTAKMKSSMHALCPEYNTNRMVRQYAEEKYLPAHKRFTALSASKLKGAKALAAWKENLRANWAGIKILDVKADASAGFKVGDTFTLHALIDLGKLSPEDVTVEMYFGELNAESDIGNPKIAPMTF